MAEAKDVLVRRQRGAGELCERLRALGFSARAVGGTERVRPRIAVADHPPRAFLVGTDLSSSALTETFALLEQPMASGRTTGVAVGPIPAVEIRNRFQEAGVALALYEPFDDRTLRFQVNRAFLSAREAGPARCELRAPIDWAVDVRLGERSKAAILYNLSPGGAFLETSRPSMRGVRLRVELPLPSGRRPVDAIVVHTNVPGNMRHANTPCGMGVRFGSLPTAVSEELTELVSRQSQTLVL